MGNSAVDRLNTHNIQNNWEKVGVDNGVQIYQHRTDGRQAERRSVQIDPKYSLNNEIQIYDYRKANNVNLVKSYEVQNLQDGKKSSQAMSKLCSEKNRVSVLTERVSSRLSQLPQLTFPESLYVLQQTLPAYDAVYHKTGPIHINSDLIGINDKGQVRAWVNQNWAVNHPSHELNTLKSTTSTTPSRGYQNISPELRDQSEMVKNLINVVEDKNQEGKFPNEFGEELRNHSGKFKTARTFLDEYIAKNHQNLPQITSIKKSRVLTKRAGHQIIQQQTKPIVNPPQPITHFQTNQQTIKTQPAYITTGPQYQTHEQKFKYYSSGNQVQPQAQSPIVTSAYGYQNVTPAVSTIQTVPAVQPISTFPTYKTEYTTTTYQSPIIQTTKYESFKKESVPITSYHNYNFTQNLNEGKKLDIGLSKPSYGISDGSYSSGNQIGYGGSTYKESVGVTNGSAGYDLKSYFNSYSGAGDAKYEAFKGTTTTSTDLKPYFNSYASNDETYKFNPAPSSAASSSFNFNSTSPYASPSYTVEETKKVYKFETIGAKTTTTTDSTINSYRPIDVFSTTNDVQIKGLTNY